jgi:cytochrome c553
MMKKNYMILAAAGLALAAQAARADGDVQAGQQKSQACAACHGANGISSSDQFPILAGQYKDYIVQALHEYKDGGRNNPIMKGMAANLSDQDIKDLAAYFSSLPGPLHPLPHQ